jgi:putative aldouronate transport system permease protein
MTSNAAVKTAGSGDNRHAFWPRLKLDMKKNWPIYLMLLPAVIYYLLFHYMPMLGAQIAFKDYDVIDGVWGSAWVGFEHFIDFFNSYYFVRLIRNTIVLSFYDILFGFPAPIILAILLNEVRSSWYKRTIQTVSYMPHFISMVVVCGMVVDFCSQAGIFNQIRLALGFEPIAFLGFPQYFRGIYVISGIWQQVGWNSIIYMASIANIDQELYEAAKIDGAGRFQRIWSVTLPGLLPMIVILLILRLGNLMTMGADKILLLYNPSTYSTADVIASFVYRKGLLEGDYSYSTAIGLFNSIINFIILISVNRISRKLSESSLW